VNAGSVRSRHTVVRFTASRPDGGVADSSGGRQPRRLGRDATSPGSWAELQPSTARLAHRGSCFYLRSISALRPSTSRAGGSDASRSSTVVRHIAISDASYRSPAQRRRVEVRRREAGGPHLSAPIVLHTRRGNGFVSSMPVRCEGARRKNGPAAGVSLEGDSTSEEEERLMGSSGFSNRRRVRARLRRRLAIWLSAVTVGYA
jgi:hypothetical protein